MTMCHAAQDPQQEQRVREGGREGEREGGQAFYPAFEIANYVFGHGQNEPTTVDSQRCGNAAGACLMDDDARHRVLPATSPAPLRPSAPLGHAPALFEPSALAGEF